MQMLGRAVRRFLFSNTADAMETSYLGSTSIWFVGIFSHAWHRWRSWLDKDGIAIILCEAELETKYKALIQGNTVLESSLHTNISEHLNSEIGLGTITNVASAKQWLRGSFLFQRIQKNPQHYALGKGDNQTWEERVDDLVMQSIDKLRETQLIEVGGEGREADKLSSTEYGDIMSKVRFRRFFCPSLKRSFFQLYIRQSTVCRCVLCKLLPTHPVFRWASCWPFRSIQLCENW